MSEPREFDIDKTSRDASGFYIASDHAPGDLFWENFHVIEKSAYDSLKLQLFDEKQEYQRLETLLSLTAAKRDELKAENERLDAALVEMSLDYGKLRVESDKLADTLESIGRMYGDEAESSAPFEAKEALTNWRKYLEGE